MNAPSPARPLIAHVVYRFDVGGLENGVVNLINRLDRYDHAVIALTEITDFRKRVTRDRVSFHALHKPPGHGVAIYRRLHRLFRELSPTVVHTRNIAASEAQWPAALAGVPVRIHGEHGWEVGDVDGGKRSHHAQRRLVRPFVHRFVALSGEIRRYLEEKVGVPASRIAQICNGVDIERFAPADRTLGRPEPIRARFPEDRLFIVGTVGRLSPVKNQRLLVEAFARAGQLAPAFADSMRLVIAGDGPDRRAIEADIVRTGIGDRTWMAGSRDDVPGILAGLDLFVLPSLAEGISNTILESMASGVPVLATKVGGNAELVTPGTSGTLVKSDDADVLAAAIVDYVIHPDRADVQGANAREIATARFSIDAMVAQYVDLYDRLIEQRARPSHRVPVAESRGALDAPRS